ncbi:aspartate kinase [Streptomyces sp. NPDC090025]|uniref:aspartate kinase n=1 Tax=Streptomyces sp. NPDC090025 TaxID=3365922 RepID=UPI0038383CFD
MATAATATVVQKFGGSSLATTEHLRRVARRVARVAASGRRVAVVVSAQGKTTDNLIRAAGEINPDADGRELDQLLATGESASAALTAMALQRLGTPATALSGTQTGILASGPAGSGVIVAIDTERAERLLDAGQVVVIAGFQGVDQHGDIITLGRGGSDTTAVAAAAELGASHCEIYTDVPGVLSADPRLVPGARLLTRLDMDVMAEMAFAGAKVMHSRAVELAALCGLDIHVGHSAARSVGTRIHAADPALIGAGTALNVTGIHATDGDTMLETQAAVMAVVHDQDAARVTVRTARNTGTAENPALTVFRELGRRSVPADMTSVHEEAGGGHTIALTVPHTRVAAVREFLAAHAADTADALTVDDTVAKVSIVGKGLLSRPQYAARMLSALNGRGISAGSFAASQLRISVTVPRAEVDRAVRLLHTEFELDAVTGVTTADATTADGPASGATTADGTPLTLASTRENR